ncbi:DNA polymerase IV [Pontivivens insulae]|uniref:DNA polymerase IV n=1 Tax=Pontivivens insulae TaxID=1639689 RepID=A0A2R8A632_9RHOB|nr:DNA polymerase IV [Pontivivens insulae]RED17823.1 DNA polymerase-4 [Pontivivens insulae]SPF27713.1 DNA polymerase IV [Pontivivens insulae]
MDRVCRDCLDQNPGPARCRTCGSPRIKAHDELFSLSIAHMDCDAFYASVEKRDHPHLRDQPVIVGGGKRGVVTTACYVARIKGVRSAMPMFKALKLCPEAVVVPTRMNVYADVSRQIRTLMEQLTPAIQPISLDEAFLDLTGTGRLHGAPPAVLLAKLAQTIETETGITISIGLSHNKFLAKVASDLDKPRGFSVIGRAETLDFLEGRPVGMIWGVGAAMRARLERDGIRTVTDIRRYSEEDLFRKYGGMGAHIWRLSNGMDSRQVSTRDPVKSVSNERTFSEDISDLDLLDGHLWRLALKVSDRCKAKDLAGSTVNLKLKSRDFRTISRQTRLEAPTQLADEIYNATRPLLERELPKGPFRLLGVGLSHLSAYGGSDAAPDLLDPDAPRRRAAERASDRIREKFGEDAILKGRALR